MFSLKEQQNWILFVVQELDGLLMFQIFPCMASYMLSDGDAGYTSTFVQGPSSTFVLYLGKLRKKKTKN